MGWRGVLLIVNEQQGPATVTLRVGGVESPVVILKEGADAGGEVSSIKDLTQWYTTQLEEIIGRNPEQYWWVHRRWKDPRTRRRSRVRKAA